MFVCVVYYYVIVPYYAFYVILAVVLEEYVTMFVDENETFFVMEETVGSFSVPVNIF